ncbi:MAG: tRNA nucleotidyltransferase [Clostridia bacterium]|nr:tRNA nucleotidyltransferase [Clostridia bacterium]
MLERLAAGIPDYILSLMDALESAGRRGYAVGGCVRDLLLGRVPDDFDMTSNAPPEELMRILAAYRVIPTGLQHGTVTVLSEGHPVEITTHRTDGTYSDSRHPDTVTFTERVEEDLARRDFTINAMAYHPEVGIVDPYGGRRDLARGVIRAVGDPQKRFREDALRILRCFRFAAKLQFEIEEETERGAAILAPRLADIAVERILTELCKLLEAPGAVKALFRMEAAGVLPYVFPEAIPDSALFDTLNALPPEASLRLAALLSDKAAATVEALCRRLHASNAFIKQVVGYLAAYKSELPTDAYTARRFLCHHFGQEEGGLALHKALNGEDITAALDLVRQVRRDRTAVELRRLALNGRELQEQVGVPPAETGKLLLYLQDQVWRDPACNRRETLLALARQYLSKGE